MSYSWKRSRIVRLFSLPPKEGRKILFCASQKHSLQNEFFFENFNHLMKINKFLLKLVGQNYSVFIGLFAPIKQIIERIAK
jgi:hypothetical protein